MHDSVLKWAAETVVDLGLTEVTPVLEVGSYDVNGSVRPLFADQAGYVGVDVVPGPGVDRVIVPPYLPWGDGTFAVVVSTEMLEHTEFPVPVLADMVRVLRPGGALLLTTRSPGFEFHNPPDYHRFTRAQLCAMLCDLGLGRITVQCDPQVSGVFASAFKPGPSRSPRGSTGASYEDVVS